MAGARALPPLHRPAGAARGALLAAVVLLAPLLPSALQAACLNRASLDSGILFGRSDGSRGLAVALGEGRVRIDYALGRADRVDLVEADWGIYTRESLQWSGPAGTPGTPGAIETAFRRTGSPPEPAPGAIWKTRLTTTAVTGATETQPRSRSRARFEVTYSFQDLREAVLDGCSYRMIPVEATFVGESAHFSYRWAYFPDLGFGVQTRYADHRAGTERKFAVTSLRLPR
jgi:hypothetical protein